VGAGPLGGLGLLGPLGGFFGGALRSSGLFGLFWAFGLSGLLLPGEFDLLRLFGGSVGALGLGLLGCCEPSIPIARKSDAPAPGTTARAVIEINTTDHRTLRKFIVVSLNPHYKEPRHSLDVHNGTDIHSEHGHDGVGLNGT
jgi:hypothetical protein